MSVTYRFVLILVLHISKMVLFGNGCGLVNLSLLSEATGTFLIPGYALPSNYWLQLFPMLKQSCSFDGKIGYLQQIIKLLTICLQILPMTINLTNACWREKCLCLPKVRERGCSSLSMWWDFVNYVQINQETSTAMQERKQHRPWEVSVADIMGPYLQPAQGKANILVV